MSEKVDVLVNPFSKGEKVVVPAGATFTTTAPKVLGRQKTKRKTVNTVEIIFESHHQSRLTGHGPVSWIVPPRIYCAGAGGYWKEITITEEIIRLNGKAVEYKSVKAY